MTRLTFIISLNALSIPNKASLGGGVVTTFLLKSWAKVLSWDG